MTGRPPAAGSGLAVLALCAVVSTALLGAPARALGLEKPAAPVVFIHGLAGSAATWTALATALVQQGWTFGGVPGVDPGTGAVSAVDAADFYVLRFSDNQGLTLDEQAVELDAVLAGVLAVNPGATQVILVGHSMGGLAARRYLQFRLRDENVSRLVAVGTPHLGAEAAVLCQQFPGICPLAGSVAIRELRPDSDALRELNAVSDHPLPATLQYTSIIGIGTPVIGSGTDGDGVVSARSQNLGEVAGTAGLRHRERRVPVPGRPDCDLGVRQTHTCEPSDPTVWAHLVDAVLDPTLALSLDQATYAPGDVLRLSVVIRRGFPAEENTGDFYLVVRIPDGSLHVLDDAGGASALSVDRPRPFRRAITLAQSTEVLLDAPLPSGIPAGEYRFFAVFLPPGGDLLDIRAWRSNLAEATMTVVLPSGSATATASP